MRAWVVGEAGRPADVRLAVLPDLQPGPSEVLVRVGAVALNYRDLLVMKGDYTRGVPPAGAVPCSDAAGEVMAVGAGVSSVGVGDRVTSHFAPDWQHGALTRSALRSTLGSGTSAGMLAEQVLLPERAVVPVPEGFSIEKACTLPCAALTAWHALFEERALGPSATVLTLGTGGVSVFALQMARASGARVIATTASSAKADRLRALGADAVVNYSTDLAWGERVREMTGGEGVDLVIEVGGQGTLEQSCRAVRPGGTIALIGTLAGFAPVNLTPILLRNIRLQGVTVGSREMFERMNLAFAGWRIEPVVDRMFAFDDAPRACEYLASGQHVGKVIIRVG